MNTGLFAKMTNQTKKYCITFLLLSKKTDAPHAGLKF